MMFGSKAEEMYYKTMPEHEPYTYEPMRARGEYSAVSSTRGAPVTNPDGTVTSEWDARRKVIDRSGWAATNTAAYRPLGTPDLDRRRSNLPGRRLGGGGDDAGAGGAGALNGHAGSHGVSGGGGVGGGGGSKGPRKHEDRRLASDG